jgi:mannosyltransferase OCH1-like enzyme
MDLDILLIWIIIGFLLTLNRIYTTNYRYIIEKLIGLGIVIWMSCINIKYGLALSVFYLSYLIHNNGYSVNEGMENENIYSYITKNNVYYNNIIQENLPTNHIIPLDVYQTWHSKHLPPYMEKCVNKMKKENPEFKFHLYDDNDCREFIQQNYDSDVLYAFDKLTPGAYKADLWRYCILYKKGGIYLDIKYQCANNFKLIQLTNKEYFVLERPGFWEPNTYGIYNAFIVCKPYNPYLDKCIKQIVKNVKNNYYGYNPLYPTGPGLFGNIFFGDFSKNYEKVKDFNLFYGMSGKDEIIYKNTLIFNSYPEYRNEQKINSNNKHYQVLWLQRNIYNNI